MKKPTALITGIGGFAGSHLAEELLNQGYKVSGTLLKGESTRNLKSIKSDLDLVYLNITNRDGCLKLLSRLKPEFVFHLAALASVGNSFDRARQTLAVNLDGTLNLLEAARTYKRLKRFLLVSSSDAYGQFRPQGKVLTENQPLNPVSPYGISKAAGEQLGQYFFRQYRLPIVFARPFNHSGPRQTDRFVVPAFARQIAAIEAGRQKPLMKVGDLSARRDLSDVRDIIRGYRQAVEKGNPGATYQFCSGQGVAIKTVLNRLVSLSPKEIDIQVDPARLRKAEIPILRGSNLKASQQLGYRVRYKLKDTLHDTLQYWRVELGVDRS